MIEHELCYRMGPIRMPHLVDARVGGLPLFYCTCGQWDHMRNDAAITAKYVAIVQRRHKKHVRENRDENLF